MGKGSTEELGGYLAVAGELIQKVKRIYSWSRRAGRDETARPKKGELRLPI